MTIQDWTLIFSAATSGMVLGGGIWLRHVVDRQLKLKDTTIETHNATIKLHESEIAALKADRAPAIAAEHKAMREFADGIASEKQKLEEQVKAMAAQQKEKEGEPVNPKHEQAKGLMLAAQILTKNVTNPAVGTSLNAIGFINGVVATMNEITKEVQSRMPENFALAEAINKAQERRTPSV